MEAIENIEEYVKYFSSEEEFVSDKKTCDAVLRNFEIIGEAAKKLNDDLIKNNPDIEWEKVIGMRNFIIHEYFGVI
ncbi:MAG: DUF86 domain-containing protein [Patescibacteria group bacterium]|nr:DUF86 domain-containing protein [Patescibacteria group bacterium]